MSCSPSCRTFFHSFSPPNLLVSVVPQDPTQDRSKFLLVFEAYFVRFSHQPLNVSPVSILNPTLFQTLFLTGQETKACFSYSTSCPQHEHMLSSRIFLLNASRVGRIFLLQARHTRLLALGGACRLHIEQKHP